MRARFLLGRAGEGKTFACLEEARAALLAEPEGAPLIFLAPKQATFQLERQLLADGGLGGYTRLRILSFERLAQFVLDELGRPTDNLLSEQGRTMALRALLTRRKDDLEIFKSREGLARFAGKLSDELREWQRRQFTPAGLAQMSKRADLNEPLRRKLHDLGLLLGDYLEWLQQHKAQDPDRLLALAAEALDRTEVGTFPVATLWMDGFAEMSAGELSLLTAVARHCGEATLAFCLDGDAAKTSSSWLSIWNGIEETRRECATRLGKIKGIEIVEERPRAEKGRFSENAALAHLERHWTLPEGFAASIDSSVGAAVCATPEMEAVFAAREIVRFVRDHGGRYREAAVLVRSMEGYSEHLRRVFSRYGIPYFLDQRASASHHPLAELTRTTLRAVAFEWGHDDWFGALKTGLVSPDADAVDRLENEALMRGWRGETWFRPLSGEGETVKSAERLRKKWIAPFARFRSAMDPGLLLKPSGEDVARAIRDLWRVLRVEARIEAWSEQDTSHTTVWEQMNILLDDLGKAFAGETLALREWLAIIEAGLTGLTVGVIPPALDQVLVGAVDRSRNPELRLALLLGLNETVFPAAPRADSILSEADRDELRTSGAPAGPTRLQLLGREQFLAYIACTRSRERLVVTWAEHDGKDAPLNPSPFVAHLKKLFPALEPVKFAGPDWRTAEHPCELVDHLVETRSSPPERLGSVLARPEFALLRQQLRLAAAPEPEGIADLTNQLYGPALRTSVSRLEDYAACAFKFFARSGLRAEERQIFELDVRERGSFQHEALARFHNELTAEGRKWRDLTPEQGRERIRNIVDALATQFRDGLLASNPAARFAARTVAETLGDFVATSIEWMRAYEFDPGAVELSFGEGKALPAWEIDLGAGRRLSLRGIIDRIDLRPVEGFDAALAIVMDYKSGEKKLDRALLENGLQLQLAGYLTVLRRLASPRAIFGVDRLIPAGMFYVNLRGKSVSAETRNEALQNAAAARQAAFRHFGRFDFGRRQHLDASNGPESAQFNFKLKRDGGANATMHDAMDGADFLKLLDDVEAQLRRMGQEVYDGALKPNPYQKGSVQACHQCECQAVCRFDPWTQEFRKLK